MSSIVSACTFAPASAPLCAIGVAIEIAFAQLCPGKPGMFDGKRSVIVGTVHAISPMSSEPPPIQFCGVSAPRSSLLTCSDKPKSGEPNSFWIPFANVWSLSSHFGMPTVCTLACIACAIGLLKCADQPEPRITIVSTLVSVIIAAPSATFLPISNSAIVRG